MTTDKRQKMEEFIWDEIESLWQSCLTDRLEDDIMGVPPESLHIEQCSSGTLEDARCVGKVLRVFIRDDSGLHELQMPFPEYKTGSMRKPYWEHGYATYFVNRTGETGVFMFQIGPLYGRGWVLTYDVTSPANPIRSETRWVS